MSFLSSVIKVVVLSVFFLNSFVYAGESPFLYKKKVEQPVYVPPVIEKNPELSEKQTKQTIELVKKIMRLNENGVKNSDFVYHDKKYFVMSGTQMYIGLSSGMYVLFDNDKGVMDYLFKDSKLYAGVLSKERYEAIKAKEKSLVDKAIDNLKKSVSDDKSKLSNNHGVVDSNRPKLKKINTIKGK